MDNSKILKECADCGGDGDVGENFNTYTCSTCDGVGTAIDVEVLEKELMKKTDSVCMSIRHDYGLMSTAKKKIRRFFAQQYIIAICKEIE